jgi:transcriptional regulator with GAF, ATPase, and Fis domain
VSVRVITATNRNLEQEVKEGRFRRGLFFRLSVFPLRVPPLRDRLDDIPALASSFLEQAARRMHSAIPTLTRENDQELTSYSWPGNVRELQNVIERAVILASGGTLRFGLHQADDQLLFRPASSFSNLSGEVSWKLSKKAAERSMAPMAPPSGLACVRPLSLRKLRNSE